MFEYFRTETEMESLLKMENRRGHPTGTLGPRNYRESALSNRTFKNI